MASDDLESVENLIEQIVGLGIGDEADVRRGVEAAEHLRRRNEADVRRGVEAAERLRRRGFLLRRRSPEYGVVHSAIELSDGCVLQPGERRMFVQQPQRPFRGRWLFTHDADPAVWILDLRVGNQSVFPTANGVPATFWGSTMYESTLRGLGLVTSKEQAEQIEKHPLFERLRVDFPTCDVGHVIAVIAENRSPYKAATFKATVAGKMLAVLSDEPEHFVAEGPKPSDFDEVPRDGVKVTSEVSPPAEPPPVPEASTDKANGAAELLKPCRMCGAGSDQPCHGLRRGEVHKGRASNG
jgi:plasmid stabilization system protein ParE